MALTALRHGSGTGELKKEDTEELLYVTTHQRQDYDNAFITLDDATAAQLKSLFFKSFNAMKSSSLGKQTDKLPPELLGRVCLQLDVASALRFSQVSHKAQQVIAAHPIYKQVRENAANPLFIALQTGLAKNIFVGDLHAALCSEKCAECDAFGGFIFLLTATRYCFDCIKESSEVAVVSLNTLTKVSGVPIRRLEKALPILRTLVGKYGYYKHEGRVARIMGWETTQYKRVKVTTVLGAVEFLAAEGIDELGGLFAASQSNYQRHYYTYMTSTPLAHFDPKTKVAQTGMYCTGCYGACNRDLGGIRAAWVTEHRKYLQEQFLEHYKSCVEAQNLWDAYLKEEEQ